MGLSVRANRWWTALVSVVVVFGCAELPLDNTLEQLPLELHSDVTVSQLATELDHGAVRVEITVDPAHAVAHRIEIEPGEVDDDEEISARIVGIEPGDHGGTLGLAIAGGFRVQYTPDTRFELPNGDEISMSGFATIVTTLLGENIQPPVEVERDPAIPPQAPDDPSFVAARARLLHEAPRPTIEVNVDADNLSRNDAPPPLGWLTVFGVALEIRETTVIEKERPEIEKREFEGVVASVDLAGRSFTLEDGTVVKLHEDTDVLSDHAPRLERLEAVAEAIEAGLTVVAAGVGAVESADPLVLIALRLRFGIKAEHITEFRGEIASVDVANLSFTLEGGQIIKLVRFTWIAEGDHESKTALLERIAKAIEDNTPVFAVGAGVEVDGDPPHIVALKVAFHIGGLPKEFEGVVAAVDLVESAVTLESGAVIKVTDETVFHEVGDRRVLKSLEEVAAALDDGETVVTAGVGTVESREPLVIVALKIVFVVKPPPLEHFEGVVTAVDPTLLTLALESGTIIRLDDETNVHHGRDELDLHAALERIAQALEDGKKVVTAGAGIVESEDPLTILAREIMFVIEIPGATRFHGVIASVDLAGKAVVLENGTVVQLTADTKVHADDGNPSLLPSLEAVVRAIDDGKTVVAVGIGVEVGSDPLTLEALEIAFVIPPPTLEFFQGLVVSVDVDAGRVTLTNGTVLQFHEESEIVTSDYSLASLRAVADALEDSKSIVAAGIGRLVGKDPLTIAVVQALFVVKT